MVFQQNHLRSYTLLFFLIFIIFLLFENIAISPAYTFREEIERDIYLSGTDDRKVAGIISLSMSEEAKINLVFHLFPNSTNNITLLINPESVWNVTSIKIDIDEAVNVTVTNGIQDLDPDVFSPFSLDIHREALTDEIWAYLFVGIITRGWHKTPWSVFPGFLALFALIIRRYHSR